MATPAMDPKSALLADDLKEFALTLPTTTFPKNFFCALCNSLAFDSWKLLCCNKSICSPCQAKLEFPTTCPSCDHTPLESDSCSPNKSLRNTMRVWLQKQKKKEEAKAVSQAATPTVEAPPAAPEVQPTSEAANKPAEEHATNVEAATGDQDLTAAHVAEQTTQRASSTTSQMNEDSTSQNDSARRDSNASQALNKGAEPQIAEDAPDAQGNMNGTGDMFGNNAMMNMNGMQGQFGYGFNPNQSNFNGMGWNGMGPMNGMQNMMGNGNWNGMNPMDFNMNNNMNGMSNMPNGMYGGIGGNMGMGMGMNDMSMNMNYGGGYGNGWNGMGGGYGNFNGFNQMGGYNQSGAYPEMNQFPKNNFPNQNRFHANGGAPPQRNSRKGSQGGFGPGSGLQNNANSRPESRNGPQQSRDGEPPEGDADAAVHEVVVENEQAKASTEPTDEGKESAETAAVESTLSEVAASGAVSNDVDNLTQDPGNEAEGVNQSSGLKQIQTVDSGEPDLSNFDQPMMNNVMQPNMPYPQGMMNQFQQQGAHMNGPYNPNMNMNMNMGYNQNNYGLRGGNGGSGFNAAYGAATVLTGEPRGLGVEGAPTGPRAMREGRPNTGFSSRANNARFNPPPKSVTPAQENAPASPPRRVRSRSPQRDDSLRTKDKSPSRSRSGSRARGDDRHEYRDRSRSVDREDRQEERGPSPTAREDDESERRKERRHHRSSRYDDRDDDYDDRRREDRDDRGDRTRSASADSKYRSGRRDKEKHRSSRSHRDRSREHRRRHRSRSRSAAGDKYEDDDGYTNGDQHSESGSRRKHRSEKDKYRERERDRSRDRERDRDRRDRKERDRERDRDRDRDREYEHDYEREKDRSREKDRDRKRRRDREAEEDDRDYEDDKYRSSRRSRKERERDRERDKDRDYDKEPSSATSARPPSPPLNAPTGPSANGFSIKGRSKNTMAPPSGPRALQPPKGPAVDREKERRDSRDHRRKSSVSSIPSAPATPTTQDHYAAERERNARERDRLDRDNRDTLVKNIHTRVTSRPSLSSKRSRDDFESSNAPSESAAQDRPIKAPTGPSAHRDKRRKSGGDDNIAKLFAAGLRKSAGKAARRGGVRTEGDGERDLERVERERDRR